MNKNTLIALSVLFVIVILGGGYFIMNAGTKNQNGEKVAEQSAPSPTKQEVKKITLEEITKHSTETDCWMAINGKIYNVTDFVSNHPGGKAILRGCGKDASVLFNERPTNQKGPHPEQAKEMLPKFQIGELSN